MTAPDFMPILGRGAHGSPKDGACIMEYVSILAGEPFTDTPQCTFSPLAGYAIYVNDHVTDEERRKLLPLIPRLINTAIIDGDEYARVAMALSQWVKLNYGTGISEESRTRMGKPEFLIGVLDEFDRLTGRDKKPEMPPEEYKTLEAKRLALAGV